MHLDSDSEKREVNFRIGVLLIGSLYWSRKKHRKGWRHERLELSGKEHVKVPIRYGRRSQSRGCTFTMVFSTSLSEQEFGHAIVVPCRSRDPIEEAVCLWTAETAHGKNEKRRISADWGCVVLLANPSGGLPDELRESWTKRVLREPCYGHLNSAIEEKVVVDKRGFLDIPWPVSVDGEEIALDALLATATNPTIIEGRYRSAKDIATAWKTPRGEKELRYFRNNQEFGIQTFEDDEIHKFLGDGVRGRD